MACYLQNGKEIHIFCFEHPKSFPVVTMGREAIPKDIYYAGEAIKFEENGQMSFL